jgi:signal transduction histidine kinase
MAVVLQYICKQLKVLLNENKKIRDNSMELQLALQRKNKTILENYDEDIHHVTLKERNRIARDIHDNVGHLLSRSILQIGAVQAIIQSKRFKDSIQFPDELSWTREDFIEDSIEGFIEDSLEDSINYSLDSLKDSLDLAMTSVRQSVHNLRDDSIDLQDAIRNMIQPVPYKVEFTYEISSEIENNIKFCFLGVLKEAITNISKHSNATKVLITLKEHPAFYQLLIHDNGSIQRENPLKLSQIADASLENDTSSFLDYKSISANVGMGIENMIERVEMLDGYFNIATEDGFKIFISLPK